MTDLHGNTLVVGNLVIRSKRPGIYKYKGYWDGTSVELEPFADNLAKKRTRNLVPVYELEYPVGQICGITKLDKTTVQQIIDNWIVIKGMV